MSRLQTKHQRTRARRIAIVEDDPGLLASMKALLARDGHEVRGASDVRAGVELVRAFRPHLTLLDYYMPGGTGADAVRAIRTFDLTTQVLLVTGYASEQPARTLLAELDIQGYHDKADGPDRLLVLIDAALKHGDALERLERQRRGLAHIVAVSPRLNRLQPAGELLQVALEGLGALLDGHDGIIATVNHGLFVLDQPTEGVSVHAATGHYAGVTRLSDLPAQLRDVVLTGLTRDAPGSAEGGYVVIPLSTRGGDRGCMVVEASELPLGTVDACKIYAQHVVQALENVILFERATVDPLTGLYTRGFGLQRLEETLRLGSRVGTATSVVLIDLDRFKHLNDSLGHAAGDVALRGAARAVLSVCRSTDVAIRYGGEELLIVLPATDPAGSATAAERLRVAIEALATPFEGGLIKITASLGVATGAGHVPADELVRRADVALYRAKAEGRNRACFAEDTNACVA